MKLKFLMAGFVILCVLTLSSCSNKQLENMNILTTYFADVEEGETVLGGGVANVRTLSDSMADKPVSLVFAKGKSLSEAEASLEKSADHPLFFGGIRAVVVSEEFAKGGIYEFIEGLKTDYKLRSESMFFVTRSDPRELVEYKAINDFSGGFAAESLLKALEKEGKISYSTLSDIFEMMSVEKSSIAIACVDIDEEILRFGGYAIFDGGKLVEFTNDAVNEGINLFLNKNACREFYFEGKKYTAQKTKERKSAYFEGGQLKFNIELEFECSGDEENVSDAVLSAAKSELEASAKAAYDKARQSGWDFLELYRVYQKDYRYEFENADYNEQLKNSSADIKIIMN